MDFSCKTKKWTTLSSSEAECIAVASGFKEALFRGTCGVFVRLIFGIRALRV